MPKFDLSGSFCYYLRVLKIRLQRVGRKHEPVFRVVLTDSKNSTKSGKYLEVLGSFDARSHERQTVDAERV
ncbi:MAG: 30S ribosomal protein S16, partial [Candidatus Pacebacteria bacterium]|nr:30S ribosomal protein S16 [Candidatus Paceibacterota bacterium]